MTKDSMGDRIENDSKIWCFPGKYPQKWNTENIEKTKFCRRSDGEEIVQDEDEEREKQTIAEERKRFKSMKLEVKNLKKTFGEKEVLHGISFSIESGKALGLLGRNGAGKTTTIRILMDVFRANSGEILLDGEAFVPSHHQIGYLPEERGLYPKKTVGEQIVYLGMLRGLSQKTARENMKKWLERLGVAEYENRKLEALSKGNQQKVQLAQTLVCDPEIVILDEPFSGLDPVNSQILKDVVSEQIADGKLVIFSSHQMSYVEEFCEDVVIINHGEIVLDGELREIKRAYGKDRLVLGVIGKTAEELREMIAREWSGTVRAAGVRSLQNQVILELLPGHTAQEVLRRIAEQELDVEIFGKYEPSLTEIFVHCAGDEAEENEEGKKA